MNPREAYEALPMVQAQRDLCLHRRVVLARQTDLVPLALAGDAAAQDELMGLSELTRSISATTHALFGHITAQAYADRWRHAAERGANVPNATPPAA